MIADLALRLVVDLVAIGALAFGLYHRRGGTPELVVVLVLFNVGLLLALTAIVGGDVSIGVGFGLFAVLSIIRLRSEPFSHRELAYFFLALVVGLVCGLADPAPAALSVTVAVIAAALVDHPRLLRDSRALEVTLETIPPSDEALRRHLEERLNRAVLDCRVVELDYVRETARVAVRCATVPLAEPADETVLHAPLAHRAG